jgi:hypothetical protein
MINSKRICLVQFRTHAVYIDHHDDNTIHIFKYDDDMCDFDVFTGDQYEQAGDYILVPLPNIIYRISVDGE